MMPRENSLGKPRDKNLSWHEQRKKWNREGLCSRQACLQELPTGYRLVHAHTGLEYCARCADLINRCNRDEAPDGLVRLEGAKT